jgi:outer membrane usher protein
LTLEGHAEGAPNFGNGGFGLTSGWPGVGLFSLAATGSWFNGHFGGQAYGAFETQFWGFSFNAASQRTFGTYDDLASVTSSHPTTSAGNGQITAPKVGPEFFVRTAEPPRAFDRVAVGTRALGGGINFGYVHVEDGSGQESQFLSASYTRSLPWEGSFYATVFGDLNDRRAGVFAGASFPLGKGVVTSSAVSTDRSGLVLASDVSKTLTEEPGSFGWRVRDVEGNAGRGERSVGLGYRGNHGQIQGTVGQFGDSYRSTVQLDGSIVAAGGGVFAANRIDDAFAVVDAGAADIDVFYENRFVARTDGSGKALVATLRAYQRNKVSIDPSNLPINASIETTQEFLAPPDRAGVVVDFGIKTDTNSAIVVLTGPDGELLPAGLQGSTETGQDFVVGYDGRTFITHLAAENTVTVTLSPGECHARFSYVPQGNSQITIGPVLCQ